MNDITQQLKKLCHGDINPKAEWVAKNRSLLLSQIKNTVPKEAPVFAFENVWSWLSVFMPRQMVYSVVRPVAVLVIVALVGTSGAIAAVDASYESLPGDFLYPATRAAQKTQIALVSLVAGKDAETQTRIKITEQLAVKTQKIIKINDATKNARLTIAVADLKNEMSNLSNKLEENATHPTDPIKSDVVKDVKANSDQIKGVLQEVKDNLQTSQKTEDQDLTKQVSEAKDLAKDVGVKAVGVLVTNYVNGTNGTTSDDIKQVLVTAALLVNSDASSSKQNINDVKNIVDGAKSEVKDHATEAKDGTGVAVSPELVNKINFISNQTVAAIIKTDIVVNDVNQKASEATKFAESGDFAKAIDKIKEASDATKVVEKISDAAIAKAQTVAPAVTVIKDGPGLVATAGSVVSGTLTIIPTTLKITTTTIKTVSTTPTPIK